MKNNLEFYDQSANSWWQKEAKVYALYYLNPLRFEYFDRHIKSWQGLKILDVGCEGGFSCEYIAARGSKVFGVDRLCISVRQKKRSIVRLTIRLGKLCKKHFALSK